MERKVVEAAGVYGNGMWNHFTGRKKYTVKCGSCQHSYTDKVPFTTGDLASSLCPSCGSQNTWSHGDFAAMYEQDYRRRTAAR